MPRCAQPGCRAHAMHGEPWCRAHHPALPRRGGAPAGNRNAWRHGLYARWFSAEERAQLAEVAGLEGLTAEVAVLRVALARLLASGDADLTAAERLAVVARGVDALGRALRTQRLLTGGRAEGLAEAFDQVLAELGIGAEADAAPVAAGV